MLLTNCLPCILSLEKGLELMREAGGPMGCGIFYFYKVFSRAFGVYCTWAGDGFERFLIREFYLKICGGNRKR